MGERIYNSYTKNNTNQIIKTQQAEIAKLKEEQGKMKDVLSLL